MEDKGLQETGDGDAVFEGLEANAAFADTFVSHIEDAARDAGIALKPFH